MVCALCVILCGLCVKKGQFSCNSRDCYLPQIEHKAFRKVTQRLWPIHWRQHPMPLSTTIALATVVPMLLTRASASQPPVPGFHCFLQNKIAVHYYRYSYGKKPKWEYWQPYVLLLNARQSQCRVLA